MLLLTRLLQQAAAGKLLVPKGNLTLNGNAPVTNILTATPADIEALGLAPSVGVGALAAAAPADISANGLAPEVNSVGSFDPESVTNTMVAWYDASDASTISETSGRVTQLNDKSSNNYHLTPDATVNRPNTGTNTMNSLNVIHFPQNAPTQESHLKNTSFSISSSTWTAFIVMDFGSTSNSNGVAFAAVTGGANVSATDSALMALRNSSLWRAYYNADGYLSGVAIDEGDVLLGFEWGTANQTTYKDGATAGTAESLTPAYNTIDELSLGTHGSNDGFWMDFDLAELVIYEGTLSISDWNNLGDYFTDKWGVVSNERS